MAASCGDHLSEYLFQVDVIGQVLHPAVAAAAISRIVDLEVVGWFNV